ncbi:hypothetical protein [Nocardia cerradoensis]|uniref:Major tail protein n=1 Tax=Nocardia cerradoensis TaxID=85688 RepID=A0A231GTE7_9NOCA|nr:hypothetical protein [Nocardia cerradoensis]NKY48030.1 hypothetical protein [Nocardia cerradoensis]OXR39893.1 hypothetical protein B7C42_08039 [Nocardia cerradoensis]
MAKYAVVRGKRLRATLVDACGMPLAGPRSRLVTKGFVTVKASPVWKDANDIEQENADGETCVSDRTPPSLKWWALSIELCGVDTALFNMLLDWDVVTSYDGKDIGFSDKKNVPFETGVAIELWSGVGSEDACEVPTSDDILVGAGGNLVLPYGYSVWPVFKEAQLGDLEYGAKASTFTLNGITAYAPRWGRGPYNVMPIDVDNTGGRLLQPMQAEQQHRQFRTTIAPPEITDGACPLILPSPYYGETAAEIAPEQPACGTTATNEKQSVTLTGTPTGGTFTLTYKSQTTAGIAYNAANTAVKSALEALANVGTGNVNVTGTGPYAVEFVGDLAGMDLPLMTASGAGLTGGTTPGVTVAETVKGGVYA